MQVLVTCVPQAGHLNPMLPLLSALVRGGDEVTVASGEAVREPVEAVGARFVCAGAGFGEWNARLVARTRGAPGDGLPPDRILPYFVPRLFAEIACADMVDGVLAAGEMTRPDIVVFDTYAFAGPLAAQLLGARPVNHLFGPLPDPTVMQLATDALSPLWRIFGRDVPSDAGVYEGATIAVCPPSLDPARAPRGVSLAVRPSAVPVRESSPQTPPLVYFTLGTLWANAEIMRDAIDALAALPVRLLVTVGALDPGELGGVPANVQLRRFVPQEELLPDASVVVHHAGAGTMFGALAHGVPQLALPQAADNFVNAELLHRAGAGLVLQPGEVTGERVAAAVAELLAGQRYRDAAGAVAAEIAAMPSPDEVAGELRAG